MNPLFFLLITALCVVEQATAQSDCSSVFLTLAPCLTYITATSATPTSVCCTELSVVLQSNPQCLCLLVGGAESLGVTINKTQAISLPAVCNLNAPPQSLCNGKHY